MNDYNVLIEEHTKRVLSAYIQIENPRSRNLISNLIQFLHKFVKEMQLSEKEWEDILEFLVQMSQFTQVNRNEFLLFADVLGLSQLIQILNHPRRVSIEGYSVMGPYYRANAPLRNWGDSIYQQDDKVLSLRITGMVINEETGLPINDALLDVWQAASNGLYETQDSSQPPMNLRGKFITNEKGVYEFLAIYPTSYPVPTDGPVGQLLRMSKRLNVRPAHIHFIVSAQGYKTLITEVFIAGDENIMDDPVFSAHQRMCGNFVRDDNGVSLTYNFHLTPGESIQPKASLE